MPVQVPSGARVSNPVWSPDGARLAFFTHFPDATHIYLADTDTGNTPMANAFRRAGWRDFAFRTEFERPLAG